MSSLNEINNLIFELEEKLKDRNLNRLERKRDFKELSRLANLRENLLHSRGATDIRVIEPSSSYSIDEIDGIPSITFGDSDVPFITFGSGKKIGRGIVDDSINYIKSSFSPNNDYTNATKRTLKKYGDMNIVGLQVRRTPILKVLDSVLNFISLGKFDKLKKEYGFDKLFHLYIVFRVKDGNNIKEIVVEKNQSINVSDNIPTKTKDTELLNIAWGPRKDTLNSLLNNTLQKVGPRRFFIYNPWNADLNSGNCQRFVLDLLSSNNLLGDYYKNFILQDISELVKKMPSYAKSIATGVTDFAASSEKLLGMGMGDMELQAVVIRDMPFEEAQIESQKYIKNKRRQFYRIDRNEKIRFRNIPMTRMRKGSFITKKINNNVSLIFGVLKS